VNGITDDKRWCLRRAAQFIAPPGPAVIVAAGSPCPDCDAALPDGDGLGVQPVRCPCGRRILIRP
jgi:hypothetical protein